MRAWSQAQQFAWGLLCAIALVSCAPSPLPVAFIGPLSGSNSSLGVEGREGFALGLKDLDWKEKALEVSYFDDHGQPEVCLEVTNQALAKGIRHFVFHTTSGVGLEAVRRALAAGAFCFSATVSAGELSGLDDLFFRSTVPNTVFGQQIAGYIVEEFNAPKGRVVMLGDLGNKVYANAIYQGLSETLARSGYPSPELVFFSTGQGFSAADVVSLIETSDPVGLVLCANPLTSALLAQGTRKKGLDMPLVLVPWAVNNEYIHNAGKAGEGTLGFANVPLASDDRGTSAFDTSYEVATGRPPSYYAQYGYESAWLLLQVLKVVPNTEPPSLAAAIKRVGTFKGVRGSITIDAWGDGTVHLDTYRVVEGTFTKVEAR